MRSLRKDEEVMIEKQPFGRASHESTRTIFGAAALARVTQDEADRTLDVLLKYGVNHIDTAPRYGDSELRIGPWMREHRHGFFLATKIAERRYKAAKEQFQRSLERLRVDCVDLVQLHNLGDPIEWQMALGPGGALEAAIEAREQGLVRFIGVTGHGTAIAAMHGRSLSHFDFDSILLPYNYSVFQIPKYAADFEAVVKLCKERNIAVQTIKAIALRPWGMTAPRTKATWYEPLTEQSDIDLAVHWVLSRPGIFLNTAGDITLLPKILDAASRYRQPLDENEIKYRFGSLEMTTLFV
jgi:aryl-alcohol dehydrogenase-like predicted oxidoreductase